VSQLEHFLGVAVQAAREAGHLLLDGFKEEQDPETKGGLSYDLVTIYDRRADEHIRRLIAQAFPDHGLVTEESGQVGNPDASLQWVVDPLDGTTNFAHGDPFWCVSIALLDGEELPLLGVVYDPGRHQLYSAIRGQGARRDGEPITVSAWDNLEQSLVHAINPYRPPPGWYEHLEGLVAHGIRHHGATALELAQVAAGQAEVIWGQGSHLWDVAAGILLVAEAGGRVTSYDGGPWGQHNGLIASNGLIHDEVVHMLQNHAAMLG